MVQNAAATGAVAATGHHAASLGSTAGSSTDPSAASPQASHDAASPRGWSRLQPPRGVLGATGPAGHKCPACSDRLCLACANGHQGLPHGLPGGHRPSRRAIAC